MELINPKVFVCHAGEDRNRFVEKFVKILRENGIDAWVSFWEILDGDSLIEKIFNEGIDKSSHFIIVLSRYSINKNWIKKELNIAVVKQIEENYTIIPILLDDIEILPSLKDIKYRRIKNLENVEEEIIEVINSIFGLYKKPAIGMIPAYSNIDTFILPDLSKIDNLIINVCFNLLKELKGKPYYIPFSLLMNQLSNLDIKEKDIFESLQYLKDKYYLTTESSCKKILLYPQFTTWGFQQIGMKRINGFNNIINNIACYIYNEFSNNEYAQINSTDLANKFNLPNSYSRYFVKIIEEKIFVK